MLQRCSFRENYLDCMSNGHLGVFSFSGNYQQQQQQQFFGPGYSGFNAHPDMQQPMTGMGPFAQTNTNAGQNVPMSGSYMFQQSSRGSDGAGHHYSSHSSWPKDGNANDTYHDQKPNQQQNASVPPGASYRHASGPGWQTQEVFYPPR